MTPNLHFLVLQDINLKGEIVVKPTASLLVHCHEFMLAPVLGHVHTSRLQHQASVLV